MPVEVKAWEANDGSLHRSIGEAEARDEEVRFDRFHAWMGERVLLPADQVLVIVHELWKEWNVTPKEAVKDEPPH